MFLERTDVFRKAAIHFSISNTKQNGADLLGTQVRLFAVILSQSAARDDCVGINEDSDVITVPHTADVFPGAAGRHS